uniref:Transmembrane protein 51 isoform X2 n=1 Tax=Tursiops truncatus TaxID=9739 RepID=A0A6J3Q8Y9_TURTR|nr:transmembrane protein 51 isoform X2 [Tursiops truncatus]
MRPSAPGPHSSPRRPDGVGVRPPQLGLGAPGLWVEQTAGLGGEGRLVGGASRGRRPLWAGTALRLSRSLPPARRRPAAALPASPSRSESGLRALRPRAPSTEIPRSPQPRDRGTRRRQPVGAGVVWPPAPGRPTETELDPPPPRLQRKYMLIVENSEGKHHDMLTTTVATVVSYSDFFCLLACLLCYFISWSSNSSIMMCTFPT